MFTRVKHLNIFFHDPDKKSILKICKELLHFSWVKKELPADYFRKYLYRTNVTDCNSYLSLKQYYSIIHSSKILVPEVASILDNKLSFAISCEKNNLPVPKLISYNLKHQFTFNNVLYTINNKEELVLFFQNVFNKSSQKALFLKLLKGLGGRGAILLKADDLEAQINNYSNDILNNCYIHQEVIQQHPDINLMYAGAINTLRIESYLDKKNNSHVLSALMRFGAGTSITDNVTSGGFYVPINIDSQELQGKGCQEVINGGGVFEKHPDTNTVIDGFKIPYLKEAISLAKSTAKYFPTRLIGWDIAISKNGPVIIEGNSLPSLHLTDIAYGGYCKHPLIKEMLKEVNN